MQDAREGTRRHLFAEIAEGVRWLWRQRLFRYLVLLAAASNFAFNLLPLVLIVRAQQLGASAAAIGLLFGALGLGAVAGALVAPWVHRRIPARVVLLGALWVWAAQSALLTVLPNLVAMGVVLAAAGSLGPIFNVLTASYRYALVPDRLQARVTGVVRLIAWGTVPLAALAAGLLLEAWGVLPTLLLTAALAVAVAVVATAIPTIRHAPEPEDLVTKVTS